MDSCINPHDKDDAERQAAWWVSNVFIFGGIAASLFGLAMTFPQVRDSMSLDRPPPSLPKYVLAETGFISGGILVATAQVEEAVFVSLPFENGAGTAFFVPLLDKHTAADTAHRVVMVTRVQEDHDLNDIERAVIAAAGYNVTLDPPAANISRTSGNDGSASFEGVAEDVTDRVAESPSRYFRLLREQGFLFDGKTIITSIEIPTEFKRKSVFWHLHRYHVTEPSEFWFFLIGAPLALFWFCIRLPLRSFRQLQSPHR